MRVALFGGSGFVGGYLVDALLDAGHSLSLLVRPGSEEKVQQAEACRLVSGDLDSATAIEATLQGCDAVIYCVGILREVPKQGITFDELQYAAVLRVAKRARAGRISRFLLMSANGVKVPGTPYQESKFRAEQYLRENRFDVTVFRPSVIFGDPRGTLEIATQLHRDMVAPPMPAIGFFTGWHPGKGKVLMSPVHVRDVAQAFLKALEDPSTTDKSYRLGGPEKLSWQEMICRIAAAVGKEKWILPMPVGMMWLAALIFDRLPFFPVTRDQLTMLAEGNTADPSELETLIGRPGTRFIPESLEYLRSQP
jgi:NADH dehydrogenase